MLKINLEQPSWAAESSWLAKHFIWLNALMFQLVWFAAILLQQDAWPYVSALLLLHFYLSPTRRQDLPLLIGVSFVGMLVDSALSLSGVFVFADQAILPVWLAFLWFHFAVALNHSLAWLRRLPLLLVALMGSISGPLSYLGGYRLGAVELPLGALSSALIIAVLWALALPAYVHFSVWLKRKS
ncbi:DUF2878 domain-containing protein [Motilimonas cestriensis]|uniref:DUF2878 domain-containing protein n=1 Tax=Motilimonas cestriensis TaxID=2742685 RepID=A0ABS8WAY5_9GAMM|nr:DUF2878 domain-containing protein [Motilimonas cestriensis]MCE2596184.1 DUF2878 domain-containing protein [Motilimonas cestriensis]